MVLLREPRVCDYACYGRSIQNVQWTSRAIDYWRLDNEAKRAVKLREPQSQLPTNAAQQFPPADHDEINDE